MRETPSRLVKLEAWLDRENALHDELANRRPTWWHAGKLVLGLLLVMKSVTLAMQTSSAWGYMLALLLVAGGTAFAFEGGQMLWRRWFARRG